MAQHCTNSAQLSSPPQDLWDGRVHYYSNFARLTVSDVQSQAADQSEQTGDNPRTDDDDGSKTHLL